MHLRFYVLYFVVLTLCSCNQGEIKKQEFYKNGVLKSLYRISGDSKLNGIARMYYPNGELEYVANFKNNLLDGDFMIYFEDGKLKEKGSFLMGKRNGVDTGYAKGGYVDVISHWENDFQNGLTDYYSKNGEIRELEHYTKGSLDTGAAFNSLGSIYRLIHPSIFISKSDTIKVGDEYEASIKLKGICDFSRSRIIVDFVNLKDFDKYGSDLKSFKCLPPQTFDNNFHFKWKFDSTGEYLIESTIVFKEMNGKSNYSNFSHRVIVRPATKPDIPLNSKKNPLPSLSELAIPIPHERPDSVAIAH